MKPKGAALAVAVFVIASAVAAFAVPRSQLRGRPQIDTGRELGYFVWMDGAVLHVRWTTPTPENHVFRGEVTAESGELSALTRVSLEDSDRTSLESSQRLVWNASEHLGLDGLDVTLGGPARVTLSVDARPADKALIFLGARRKHATESGTVAIGGR